MSSNKKYKSDKVRIYKQQKRKLVGLFFVVILFVVILISTVFTDVVAVYNNKKETAELTEKYNLLLEEEASLNSEVVKLQDPDYIARYAREKYLYTKDGEKILTIIESAQ